MRPEQLDRLLREAGDRARAAASWSAESHPDRAFSGGLRDRLMAALPDKADKALMAADKADKARSRAQGPRVAWSLPALFNLRAPRLVPVALAATLLLAGVVVGRTVYVALGDRPDPTATPRPSVSASPSAELLPSDSESATPSASASESGDPTVVPAVVPTVRPTAKPTAKPTTAPTGAPTATPTASPPPVVSVMNLTATGCNGGVVLEWSQYDGDGPFNHYTTLRNTTSNIPKAYPPQGGAVDPGGNYTTNQGKTSAVDTSAAAGTTYYYRSMAFDSDDEVVGASAVMSATAQAVASMGVLGAAPVAGGTDLTWSAFGGPGGCFTWYKVVYSETNPTPSYLGGDPYFTAISDQSTTLYTASDTEMVSGLTYYLRVQVIRATDLGTFLVAQTDVTTYLVP